MRIIARATLREFWTRHPQAEGPLRTWFDAARRATWDQPSDIRAVVRKRGLRCRQPGRVRHGGNKYRFVVHVSYKLGRVLIKFAGTHAEYDRIDVETV